MPTSDRCLHPNPADLDMDHDNPSQRETQRYIVSAWLLLLSATLFRLLYCNTFLLVPDEAYYWQWSRHLALGYHDHPPLIAWSIKLSTLLLGHSATAVRLPAVFSLALASVYLLAIAGRWFQPKVVWYTALISQTTFGLNIAGLIATPDSLQMAAWAGAAYHLARAYEKNNLNQWLLGGFFFGCGMLSKYTMVLLPPLIFCWGLVYQRHRRRLTTLKPYVGLCTGSLLLTPVVWWNVANGWSTFRHAAHKGGLDNVDILRLDTLFDFIGSQIGLLSPLLCLLLVLTWFNPLRRSADKAHWLPAYLFATSFPVCAFFLLLSLHTRVEGNWAASGYLTAAVILAYYVARRPAIRSPSRTERFIKTLWPWAIGSSVCLTGFVLLQLYHPIVSIPAHLDRLTKETVGWDRLAQRVQSTLESMPRPEKTFIFGMSYQTASELAFYLPGKPDTLAVNRWKRPNAYDYWWTDADVLGWDAVGLGRVSAKDMKRLEGIFQRIEPPQRMNIHAAEPSPDNAMPEPVASFYVYRAYGFKGGLHWIPPNSNDIRAN